MNDLGNIITGVLGGIAVILIVAYVIYLVRKGKRKDGKEDESKEDLFDYLVGEAENALNAGKVKEASSIYNRLNHVYQYIDKGRKEGAKKKLEEIYDEIQKIK